MKKFVFICIAAFLAFGSLQAQESVKIGYVSVDSVMLSLPEYKTQMKQYESYAKQLENEINSKRTTLQAKAEDLEANYKDMLPDIVQERQKELQQLDQNLQQFAQQAQQKLSRKEQELLNPILVKIQQGIDDVAKEQSYTFIVQDQVFLYSDNKYDITVDVIKKLGGDVNATATNSNE
ncbi:OmpH family outer membrane protein [Chondrinema litorale]|uniref:OmpH family outer membrane protein n=1 Tax=Chondrinema litorale TaxID=2994555 RepID=UPI002543BD0D|nr:OmpH family outer membrane protein [Chondrinema litorale]UZR93519.1 OmpH family outer membrane protein [Chondrinema litorale]